MGEEICEKYQLYYMAFYGVWKFHRNGMENS